MRSYIASPAPTDPQHQHQRTTSRHFVLPSFERATFQSFVRHRRWGGGERRNASVNDVPAASPRRPASMFIASNEGQWTGEGILATSSDAQPRSRLTSTGSAATIRFADLEGEAKQQVSTPVNGTQQNVPFEELLKEGSPVPHVSSTSSSSSQHSRLWLSNPVEKAQQRPAPSPRAAAATSNANYADELRLWQASREHRRTRSEAASISPLPPSDVGHASGVLVASSSLGGKPQHKEREESPEEVVNSDSHCSHISPSVLPPRPSHPSPPPFPRRMVSVTSTNEASDRTVRPEFSQRGLHAHLPEVHSGHYRHQTGNEDDVIISRSNSSLEEVISARITDSLGHCGQRERNVSLTSTNGGLSAAQGSSVLISSIYNDAQSPGVQARQSLPAEGFPQARGGSVHSIAHSLDIIGARDSFHTATTTPTADRWARAASSLPSPPPLPPRRVSSHTPSSSTDHSRSAKVRASKDLSSGQARQSLTSQQETHDVQSGEGHGRPLSGTATSLAFRTATEDNRDEPRDCRNGHSSRDYTHRLPGSFEAEMRQERAHFAQETQPQPVLPQPAVPPAVRTPIRGPRKQPPPPPSPAPQRIELPPVHSPARPSPLREASATTGSVSETSSFASIKYWRQVVAVEAFLGSTERVSKTRGAPASSSCHGRASQQQQQQRSRQASGATTGGSSPATTAGTVSSRRRLSDREAAKFFGRLAPCNVEEQRAVGRAPSTQQEAPLVVGGMVAAAGGVVQPSEDKRASMPSTNDTFGVAAAAAAARSGSLHNRIAEVIEEGQAFSREGEGHDWQPDALPSLLRRSASSPDMALLCSEFSPPEERGGGEGSLDRYAPIPSNSSHVATTSAVTATATATADDDDDDDGALLVISLIAQRVGLAGQALLSLGHDLAEYQRQATATTTPTAGGGSAAAAGGTSTSTRGARRRRDGGPAV